MDIECKEYEYIPEDDIATDILELPTVEVAPLNISTEQAMGRITIQAPHSIFHNPLVNTEGCPDCF